MVLQLGGIDNACTLSFIEEFVMLAIFLIGALGGALVIHAARGLAHSIGRTNDDFIFI